MKKRAKTVTAALLSAALLFGCGAPSNSQNIEVRVGSLKGPTSIGLVSMIHEQDKTNYSFTMETQADVLMPKLLSGDLDIALVPANAAAALYNKSEGKISVIDINTLGVLYMVSDTTFASFDELDGSTICTTGAGTTPEYVLRYLLEQHDLQDSVNIEFKSEAAEVVAFLAETPGAIGVLPQPFATAALIQNDSLNICFDLTKEWEALDNGSSMVTGVTIATGKYIDEHPDQVRQFLKDHAASVDFVNSNVDDAAIYTVEAGIIEKEPVAKKAIPACNLVCITGGDMKQALSGYLKILYDQDASSVGGALPDDNFYYMI